MHTLLDFLLTDVCCSVTRSHYLNTEEFIDAVADELRSRLAANPNLWNPCWSVMLPCTTIRVIFLMLPFSFLVPPPWRPELGEYMPDHYQWETALDSVIMELIYLIIWYISNKRSSIQNDCCLFICARFRAKDWKFFPERPVTGFHCAKHWN